MSVSLPFLSVIFEKDELFCKDSKIRNIILDYLGKDEFLNLDPELYRKFRIHLDRHYCKKCGEYMSSAYPYRELIPHNHHYLKPKFFPLAFKRIKIHPKLKLVEWERHFPSVCKFPIGMYRYTLPRRSRIPAFHLWTIQEWNMIYPELRLDPSDRYNRIIDVPPFLFENPLFMP